ncbi:MAG: protoporphyrinogen oxidase [Methylacidiphilales bacterium]|nr:protoporphyrinogen oxidase [Candidatus Methylacidiphilales bacterium]
MNSVAIVGGGITGLAAAFRLSQSRIPVTLYEAGERVGGPIHTISENGYLSEHGPNTILETSPKITSLINDLGLQPRRLDSNPAMDKNFIVRNGKMRQLPMSPLRFATSSLFSIPAKLRIGLEPLIRAKPQTEDESLADFVRRRFGREFLDFTIDPFVTGVYAGKPEDLSVRYAFPKLKALEDKYGSVMLGAILGARERKKRAETKKARAKKVSFDNGLQVLVDTLQAKLLESVALRSRVTRLGQTADGWTVTFTRDGREEQNRHSTVVLAAPAYQLARIEIEADEPADLSLLKEIPHPPVARVVMGFRREDVADPLEGFGFLVPKAENLNILGTTFSSSIFPRRAPFGHVLLTTFIGGCRQPELATQPAEKLFDLTLRDLQRILGVRGEPTYRHHGLFPWAIPQYNVGHKKFVDFMNAAETRFAGLYFAGSYRDGISTGNCIVSGHDVAGRTIQFLETSNRGLSAHAVLS